MKNLSRGLYRAAAFALLSAQITRPCVSIAKIDFARFVRFAAQIFFPVFHISEKVNTAALRGPVPGTGKKPEKKLDKTGNTPL
jgi:hypothetical protein